MQEVEILECTLRDGSYSINFQFTPADTATIAGALESAGLRMIEIGHGLGFNATFKGKGQAAATDREYMLAANQALNDAAWGMFFIPDIGRRKDIDDAVEHGIGFLRVGVNAPEVEKALPYIEYAARRGCRVFCNLMKSYALSPEKIASHARVAASAGADGVYLVDSAGYMLPHDVARYILAIRESTDVLVGFHGHDNLAMGCANCLSAVQSGARLVDATLCGLGRGGGNPSIETLNAVLEKAGYSTGVDTKLACDLGHTFIRRLYAGRNRSSLDIACGQGGFHSSYLDAALACAREQNVDPRDLVREVSKRNMLAPDQALMLEVARSLKQKTPPAANVPASSARREHPPTQLRPTVDAAAPLATACRETAKALLNIATKTRRSSVLNLVSTSDVNNGGILHNVQEDYEYVLCNVTIADEAQLEEVILSTDGLVDFYFVDVEPLAGSASSLAGLVRELARTTRVMSYRDKDVLCRSLERQVVEHVESRDMVAGGECVAVHGGVEGLQLASALSRHGVHCKLFWNKHKHGPVPEANIAGSSSLPDIVDESDAVKVFPACIMLIAMAADHPLGVEGLEHLPPHSCVLDAALGALQEDAWEFLQGAGIRVMRPDMRAALDAEFRLAFNARNMALHCCGEMKVEDVRVVAGGIVGRKGDIVVDAVPYPAKVLGVADGKGRVLRPAREDLQAIVAVERYIQQNILSSDVMV